MACTCGRACLARGSVRFAVAYVRKVRKAMIVILIVIIIVLVVIMMAAVAGAMIVVAIIIIMAAVANAAVMMVDSASSRRICGRSRRDACCWHDDLAMRGSGRNETKRTKESFRFEFLLAATLSALARCANSTFSLLA